VPPEENVSTDASLQEPTHSPRASVDAMPPPKARRVTDEKGGPPAAFFVVPEASPQSAAILGAAASSASESFGGDIGRSDATGER
jgi:hypothetical protein